MPLASVTAHWLAGWGQKPVAVTSGGGMAPQRRHYRGFDRDFALRGRLIGYDELFADLFAAGTITEDELAVLFALETT